MKNTKRTAAVLNTVKPTRLGVWHEEHGIIAPGSFRLMVGCFTTNQRCLAGRAGAYGDFDPYLVFRTEAEVRENLDYLSTEDYSARAVGDWEIQRRREDGFWVTVAAGNLPERYARKSAEALALV